ncbi:hypothetical protein EV426DRAFT_588929 [Tirmania nivea]|nr:hypothetical protein EV426DRAFT_588929 [Tirmania nivea]
MLLRSTVAGFLLALHHRLPLAYFYCALYWLSYRSQSCSVYACLHAFIDMYIYTAIVARYSNALWPAIGF